MTNGLTIMALALLLGCGNSTSRPYGVDIDAVGIPTVKGAYWEKCNFTGTEEIHCKIWNGAGNIVISEQFVPLDAKPLPFGSELRIMRGVCSGPYEVCLESGRILVPVWQFQRLKHRIDSK